MKLSGGGVFALVAVALVGWVAYEVIANKKALGDAAAKVGNAVNPLSDQNLAYQGANAFTQAVLPGALPGDTFGTWLWRFVNPSQEATDNANATGAAPAVPTASSLLAGLDLSQALDFVTNTDPNLPRVGKPNVPTMVYNPAGAAVGRTLH